MQAVATYLTAITEQHRTGRAREHSYRPALSDLLRAIAPDDAVVTNEPSRERCGAPDFIVAKKTSNIPLGYVEAKDIGVDLDRTQNSEQLQRYFSGLSKLVLTDYLEFRFFKKGHDPKDEYPQAQYDKAIRIARLEGGKIVPMESNYRTLILKLQNFLDEKTPIIVSAETLAAEMARKARLIRETIEQALLDDLKQDNAHSELLHQFRAFERSLIAGLKPDQFADLYAQTIAYGLFAARFHDPNPDSFSRAEAARLLPQSNPFLRKLFQAIAAYDAHGGIDWVIDELVEVFLATDVRAILSNLSSRQAGREDPTIHFYESFLQQYDPQIREMRGVYYTPQPVVEFMVRAVDELLHSEFGLKQGLADTSKTNISLPMPSKGKTQYEEHEIHRVQILDPATGTGTFLNQIVRHLHQTYFAKMAGAWASYVEKELLPRLNGFELLMAPYAMAHLKLDLLLAETGYRHTGDSRFRVFLTNSLEESLVQADTLFAGWLAQEAAAANRIKCDVPVMVVVGNPPYSGISMNMGEWIVSKIEDYKYVDGVHFGERKHWLQDDYVKFIRYAEYLIERTGERILAYISNHGYLDNPTFRGMRWHLLKTFDKIWIIDLHGNAKKKEKAPDGGADKNVFDIQQGVAIIFGVKRKEGQGLGSAGDSLATVFHLDLWGSRESKYQTLQAAKFNDLKFTELKPESPYLFFVPKNFDEKEEYDSGFSLTELFISNTVGFVSGRDAVNISFDVDEMKGKMEYLIKNDENEIRRYFGLGLNDARDWKVSTAKKDAKDNYKPSFIVECAYRPFDIRFTFYSGNSRGVYASPQSKVMRHFLAGENVGLCFGKRIEQDRDYADIFVFDKIIQHHSLSIKEVNYIAPLYLYPSENELGLSGARRPNLNAAILRQLEAALGLRFVEEATGEAGTFAPLDVLDYVYAILHRPSYRQRYAEFLKIDFPRVPWPSPDTFREYVRIGGQLRQWHLLTHPAVDAHHLSYPVAGDNVIDKPRWADGCVWLNKTQYFEGISQAAWDFHVGGYQPLQKWLKDRKGRALSWDDLRHYQRIAAALGATIALMDELEGV